MSKGVLLMYLCYGFRSRTNKMSALSSQEELRRERRERTSRLSAAVLRISASLHLDTVLHEAVESARALTGARYAVITTIDDSEQLEDLVTSGFTAAQRRQLADGRALGDWADLIGANSLQRTPLRYEGKHVGDFMLTGKDGGREFTRSTLINATPVRSGDGTVESVVVTMQDLAPLEELGRRSEDRSCSCATVGPDDVRGRWRRAERRRS